MKPILPLIFSLIAFGPSMRAQKNDFKPVITEDYELLKVDEAEALLILFPCFPCDAANTKREFAILDEAINNGISLLFMNYNRKLFLTEMEKGELAQMISEIAIAHNLPKKIVIGGFSGGGNVTLLLSAYLREQETGIMPEKVFVVDAPVDLLGLYRTSKYHLKQDLDEGLLEESTFLKNWFENSFGDPQEGISNYEKFSPFTLESNDLNNVKALNGISIRFYTEPDLDWWKQRYNDTYEQMNAYYIEKMAKTMQKELSGSTVELIQTKNKGYRSDGTKHPHSWSIVDKKALVRWVLQ